jgi:hypothetical protein
MRNVYKFLIRKPESKRPVGRPRGRWGDNIRNDIVEIGRVWTGLIWLRTGTSGGLL